VYFYISSTYINIEKRILFYLLYRKYKLSENEKIISEFPELKQLIL